MLYCYEKFDILLSNNIQHLSNTLLTYFEETEYDVNLKMFTEESKALQVTLKVPFIVQDINLIKINITHLRIIFNSKKYKIFGFSQDKSPIIPPIFNNKYIEFTTLSEFHNEIIKVTNLDMKLNSCYFISLL
jgi:hypothetical protein